MFVKRAFDSRRENELGDRSGAKREKDCERRYLRQHGNPEAEPEGIPRREKYVVVGYRWRQSSHSAAFRLFEQKPSPESYGLITINEGRHGRRFDIAHFSLSSERDAETQRGRHSPLIVSRGGRGLEELGKRAALKCPHAQAASV
jgi:hypothetical protein